MFHTRSNRNDLIKCNATKSRNKSIVHSVIKIKLYYYRSEIIDNPLQKENERITIFIHVGKKLTTEM